MIPMRKQWSFSRSLHNTRTPILPTSFSQCHSQFKRQIKFVTLKSNPFYQLTSNFTFTNMQLMKELQIYGNTKLAQLKLLPTLCVCENVEQLISTRTFTRLLHIQVV